MGHLSVRATTDPEDRLGDLRRHHRSSFGLSATAASGNPSGSAYQMKEPLWRTVLNWGVVITFFGAPLMVFLMHVFVPGFNAHITEYAYLRPWFQHIALLVFGLAGLHTAGQILTNGKDDKK